MQPTTVPGSNGAVVRLADVKKTYQMGPITVEALRGLSLDFLQGQYITIMGPSGCGKSTLLNLLGCLDRPTSGQYFLGAEDVSQLDDDELSAIRGKRIGFVFQSYNLIAQLNVVENIEVPLYYQGYGEEESRERAIELARMVGLGSRLDHRPYELSGGQQQRVAIARALSNDPYILLADEPTGNLDRSTGERVLDLLEELVRDTGTTLVMVTHSESAATRADVIHDLDGGRLVTRGAPVR